MIINISSKLTFHDRRSTPIQLPTRIEQGVIQLDNINVRYTIEIKANESIIKTPISNRGYLLNNILIYENGHNIGFRNSDNDISTYDLTLQPKIQLIDQKRFSYESNNQIFWCYQIDEILVEC